MGAVLEVRGITVVYGDMVAVDDVDLTVGGGEIVAVLGPSGSGKSTLLRTIAGLQQPVAGAVILDGADLRRVPPHRRGIGLMFQDHALFPHRDVGGNVAFGLRMQRQPRAAIATRVGEVLALVGLAGYERRSIASLSGGEQQRVALARALAPQPKVLLLDEPLGSLDRALRDRLVVELGHLLRPLGVTALFVTHDQSEAFTLADRVALMRAGRVVQEGPPAEVWGRPADTGVARFLGASTLLAAQVESGVAHTEIGTFPAPGRADGPATVVVRPAAVELAPDGHPGVVERTVFAGDHFIVTIATDAGPVLDAAVTGAVPEIGARAAAKVRMDRVVVVAP